MTSKTNLVETKSALAKLMATENISVQHRQVQTAAFNLHTRTLICPIWKDMSGNIYDLLMGHEISHALHTPKEGWHSEVSPVKGGKYPNLKHFLNVIEDARIEKIIKRKYPGLSKPFSAAYQELYDRDLFQIKALKGDYSKLNLIDRINLRFKMGHLAHVKFSKAEQPYVIRTENLETWDEVVQLSKDIYDFVKFNQHDKLQNQQDVKKEARKSEKQKEQERAQQESQESQDEESDSNGDEEFEESQEGNEKSESSESADGIESDSDVNDEEASDLDEGTVGDSNDSPSSEDDEESESTDANESATGEKGAEDTEKPKEHKPTYDVDNENVPEPNSITDEAFRQLEKQLCNTQAIQIVYYNIPNVDLKKAIVNNKLVLDVFEKGIVECLKRNYPSALIYSEVAMKLSAAFHKRNKNYISFLVKEFEQRKNANQYARQLTAKTGEIDHKKLSRYKFTNDIFRKVTEVQKGKSHGMVLFLDMSGSMESILRPIIEQLLILVTFCKKVGIPFDVYGFTDSHVYMKHGFNPGDPFDTVKNNSASDEDSLKLIGNSFCLRHLISSDMSGNVFKRAFSMLVTYAEIAQASGRKADCQAILGSFSVRNLSDVGLNMSNTPFIQTLICAKQIINQFKNKHHCDVINAVYLTDGDGSDQFTFPQSYYDENNRSTIRPGFQDPDTKQQVLTTLGQHAHMQVALTRLIGDVTGANQLGYYFGSEYDIKQRLGYAQRSVEQVTQQEQFLSKNGFVVAPNLGYDQYFYVDIASLHSQSGMYVDTSMTDTAKIEAFNRFNQSKKNSRALIKILAAEMAE